MPRVTAERVVNLISKYVKSPDRCSSIVNDLTLFQNTLSHGLGNRLVKPEPQNHIDNNAIFANNYLNFEDVKVVGFDMDYTLVQYTIELQQLIYTLARDMLTNVYGYPKTLSGFNFDPKFAIRGLSVDKRNGVLCKLSQLQRVNLHGVYRGKRLLKTSEIEQLYGESRHITHGDLNDQMRPLNDMFAMAEGCLIADSIEAFENKRDNYGEIYSPAAVVDDVQAAIREVHISGMMHSRVMADIPRYVTPSPDLGATLDHLRNGGKELFLCTNSGCSYANSVLTFVLGLPVAGNSWRELFDVIVCSADKPNFFSSNRRFRKWNMATNGPSPVPVSALERGSLYVNGSAVALKKAKGWTGKSVMYVGDNLWADLVEARRNHGWQTACVINELAPEINVQNADVFQDSHLLRSSLRKLLIKIQPPMEAERKKRGSSAISKACQELIAGFEDELRAINWIISKSFNQYFGSIFRTEGNLTIYAFAMRRYADIYLSHVSNFLHYSTNHRFYPPHGLHLSHDIRNYSIPAIDSISSAEENDINFIQQEIHNKVVEDNQSNEPPLMSVPVP